MKLSKNIIKASLRVLILLIVLFEWFATHAETLAEARAVIENHDVKVLAIYDQLKDKYIYKTDPLIIAMGDKLILYYHDKIYEYSTASDQYNDLKGISHVTLAVFALFNPLNQFPKNSANVKEYLNSLLSMNRFIDRLPLSREQKIRQKHILSSTTTLLENALLNQKCTSIEVDEYFHHISPLIMENIKDAVNAQIILLNKEMTKITQRIEPNELKRLFVVIPVPKNPRNDNLIGQYFSKYLNVPMDSPRLIYAEGLSDRKDILKLVGTWQIESQLSQKFFHDPDKMKKDLLGKDTELFLSHCKKSADNSKGLICK